MPTRQTTTATPEGKVMTNNLKYDIKNPAGMTTETSPLVRMARIHGLLCDDLVWEAAKKALARKNGKEQPDGRGDNAGRWMPSDEEWCSCCCYVRGPTRNYPFTLRDHCRTSKHVAELMLVDEDELKRVMAYFQLGKKTLDALGNEKPWSWAKKTRAERQMALSLMVFDGLVGIDGASDLLPVEEMADFKSAVITAQTVTQVQNPDKPRTYFLWMFDKCVWQSQQTVDLTSGNDAEVLAEIMMGDIQENALRIEY